MQEPRKGELYLIPYHACGAKPKYGTRLCMYHEEKQVGCQLHGELIAREFWFKLSPDTDFATVSIKVPCEDNTKRKDILRKFYQNIKKYG